MLRRVLLLCGLLVGLAACQDPLGGIDATSPITPGTAIPPNTAVVLVGMPSTVITLLEFHWDSLGYIKVLPPASLNLMVAVPVNIPKTGFRLTTFSTGRYGTIMPYGGSFGYVGVQMPAINIDRPGIYFIGNIDPSRPGNYSPTPIPAQLNEIRRRLGATFGNLQPVNFTWP